MCLNLPQHLYIKILQITYPTKNEVKEMKKAQGLSINVIIIAAIALIVLVVLVAIFSGRLGDFGKRVGDVGQAPMTINPVGWVTAGFIVIGAGATAVYTYFAGEPPAWMALTTLIEFTQQELSNYGCEILAVSQS